MFPFAIALALLTPITLPKPTPPLPLGSLLLTSAQKTVVQKQKSKPKPNKAKVPPPIAQKEEKWKILFDGKSLGNWKETEFGGNGAVHIEQNFHGELPAIVVETGASLSGFNWTGEALPKINYEITLDAMKIEGSDFFCGITFPVGASNVSLILGGWGGGAVGISSINHQDASENETTKYLAFMKDRWFKVRVRVTPTKIEAWLDDKQIVDLETKDKKLSLRLGDISRSLPLGFATYQTSGAFRSIKMRTLDAKTGR